MISDKLNESFLYAGFCCNLLYAMLFEDLVYLIQSSKRFD